MSSTARSVVTSEPLAGPGGMSDAELSRLRAKVDGGTSLELETEATALIAEMQDATALTKPAAEKLEAAAEAESARLGRTMTYFEMEVLWEADPALQEVKRIYDLQRARWRRASAILRESNVLTAGGEEVPAERRAPYRIEPMRPPTRGRRWSDARR